MTSFSEKLNKLCKEMLNQGYNYASLKNLNNNSETRYKDRRIRKTNNIT